MGSRNQLPNLSKILMDDDEPDFLPSGGSNLAAIFGGPKGQDAPTSVKQSASKKSNLAPNPLQTATTNKTDVIIAKAVHAYKLQNGMYASAGKLGIALTGNVFTKTYQLILYKSKQEHVSIVTVTSDFSYTVQESNYASYYDSNKENWSILFESKDVSTEFAREIGLARYFSKDGKLENVVYQDLTPPSKTGMAKEGDNICIKYFIATNIVQPVKSNSTSFQTMTVEISTDENWERVLLGTTEGLKRILFLPSTKQISLGPGFPKEKDIMMEIEIVDIERTAESPQLPKVGTGKASIISRMAKMGQSMLPKLPTSTTTDSEDTEDDVPHKSHRHKKTGVLEGAVQKTTVSQSNAEEVTRNLNKSLKPKHDIPITNVTSKPLVSASAFTPQWSPTQIQPNLVTVDGQVYSLQPQTIAPAISTVIDPGLNMLLSETRMTNTELRMGMSKIADNVQKLLDKFHVLELQTVASPTSERAAMDSTLKMLLAANTSQVGTTDNKLLNSTNSHDKGNQLELNELKSRVTMLQAELKVLKDALTESAEHIKSLEAQKASVIETNEDLYKKSHELEISLQTANDALKNVKEDLETARQCSREQQIKNSELEHKISKLSIDYSALEKAATSSEKRDDDNKNREIKHIMNETYHTLLEKFVDESYSTNYIKSTIASTIKNITLHVLYENAEKNDRESGSADIAETDINKIDNKQCGGPELSTSMIDSSETNESKNRTNIVPIVQSEPPPIPPMDSEIDSDWLIE